MAQRVRRHAFGEAEPAPDVAHALLHDGGIERAAAGADEEGLARTAGRQPGAGVAIGAQRLERLRQQRHQARLVALAGDGERVAAASSAGPRRRPWRGPAPRRCAGPRRRAAAGRRRRAGRARPRAPARTARRAAPPCRVRRAPWAPSAAAWASGWRRCWRCGPARACRGSWKKERTDEKARAVEVRARPWRAALGQPGAEFGRLQLAQRRERRRAAEIGRHEAEEAWRRRARRRPGCGAASRRSLFSQSRQASRAPVSRPPSSGPVVTRAGRARRGWCSPAPWPGRTGARWPARGRRPRGSREPKHITPSGEPDETRSRISTSDFTKRAMSPKKASSPAMSARRRACLSGPMAASIAPGAST